MTEFLLTGIPHTQGLEHVLFVFFLAFYLLTLVGNLLILLATLTSSNLHTPMYFFLGNLSVFDIFFPSVSSPKMMLYLLGQSRTISYQGCACQLFFYHFLGCTECFLYTVMAYDRFAAICHPLRYMAIMNPRVCAILTLSTWIGSSVHASVLTFLVFKLPYCGPKEVGNFFCDIPVVLPLACADTSLAHRVSVTNVGVVALLCFLLVLTSYTRIIISILRISSSEGRHRAFSTCSAHLTSALLWTRGPHLSPACLQPLVGFCGSGIKYYCYPSLNPLIYSLRNKDMKLALRKALIQGVHTCGA